MKTDLEIQKDVMEELKWEPFLNSAEIGVAVNGGIVTLSGIVNSYAKKISAEKATKRVDGVKAVAEEIEVKLTQTDWRNDVEIAEAILNTIKWYATVKGEGIKVKVENGWVTLEGEVEWIFEKNIVSNAIEKLLGVRGITNLIKITPRVAPIEIKRKINAAFHRNAAIDAKGINITVEANKVILTGKVCSLTEKIAAASAASSAPGITEVINKLEVEEEMLVI
ncbi:MAG TPA: BON domain-containing protein [Bacteroidia bacterium]|nr:BON domain-containing protein [Bacteroidia bacterium]